MSTPVRTPRPWSGVPFVKMSGSGNDFVVFLASDLPGSVTPELVRQLCARRTGIGADGVVVITPSTGDLDFDIRYLNSDGSEAGMCGNATLCSLRLATLRGIVGGKGKARFRTGMGDLAGSVSGGTPEIELAPVTELRESFGIESQAGEHRIGFAVAGVPHLVVEVDDVDGVDVENRGRALRHHATVADGANVNFVALGGGPGSPVRIRTFERGVEGETLACGTGAVASAAVLAAWGAIREETEFRPASGLPLRVRLPNGPHGAVFLAGEGRIVFEGRLGELATG